MTHNSENKKAAASEATDADVVVVDAAAPSPPIQLFPTNFSFFFGSIERRLVTGIESQGD